MLTLICGLPNAGKTTYSKNYQNVIHLDDMHQLYDFCNRRASRAKGDVCIEGLYLEAEKRRSLLAVCNDKTPKVCIWLDTPIQECIKREQEYRKRSLAMLRGYATKLEPPSFDEGWDEIIIFNQYGKHIRKNADRRKLWHTKNTLGNAEKKSLPKN